MRRNAPNGIFNPIQASEWNDERPWNLKTEVEYEIGPLLEIFCAGCYRKNFRVEKGREEGLVALVMLYAEFGK